MVKLMRNDAGAAQVASATVETVGKHLHAAADDPDVVEAVWLLVRLPWAARDDDFAAALHRCGLRVGDAPGLFDIVTAASEALDANAAGRRRSDFGKMAQAAPSARPSPPSSARTWTACSGPARPRPGRRSPGRPPSSSSAG